MRRRSKDDFLWSPCSGGMRDWKGGPPTEELRKELKGGGGDCGRRELGGGGSADTFNVDRRGHPAFGGQFRNGGKKKKGRTKKREDDAHLERGTLIICLKERLRRGFPRRIWGIAGVVGKGWGKKIAEEITSGGKSCARQGGVCC